MTEVERLRADLAEARAVIAGWEAQSRNEPPPAEQDWHRAEAERRLSTDAEKLRAQVLEYAAIADGWADEARRWLEVATRLGMDETPFEHEDETVARLREEVRVLTERVRTLEATKEGAWRAAGPAAREAARLEQELADREPG